MGQATRLTLHGMTIGPSHDLISSRQVEGTQVYNRSDQRLGTIHSVMIEKKSGRVAYALLSFGGIFGVGETFHPLPWEDLSYDKELEAYVIDLSREQLDAMPSIRLDEANRPKVSSPDPAGNPRPPWWRRWNG